MSYRPHSLTLLVVVLITICLCGSLSWAFVSPMATLRQPPLSQAFSTPFGRHRRRSSSGSSSRLYMAIVPATIKVNDLIASRRMVIFGTQRCPQTARLTGLLDSGYATYTRVNLDLIPDGPDMMAALTSMTGQTQVPLVFCHGKYMGTADALLAMNVSGRLGEFLIDSGIIAPDKMRELQQQWTTNYKMGFADGPNRDNGDWSLT